MKMGWHFVFLSLLMCRVSGCHESYYWPESQNSTTEQIISQEPIIPLPKTDLEKGKILFEANCTSCHKMGGKLIGPDLEGVKQRRSLKWIVGFLQHPKKYRKDKYFLKIKAENQNFIQTPINLSDDEIRLIIDYVNEPEPSINLPKL